MIVSLVNNFAMDSLYFLYLIQFLFDLDHKDRKMVYHIVTH